MADRLQAFVEQLPGDIDAVLVTSSYNRRYYTHFPSSAGTLLVMRQQCYFLTDSRYIEAARAAVQGCEVLLQDKLYEQLTALLKKHNAVRLGVEWDMVSMCEYARLKEKLSTVEIVLDGRVSDAMAAQRSRKSEQEITHIAAAQAIADKTFSHILDFIRPGRTELEVAVEMELHCRRLGSEKAAFAFIVAAGKNSSMPHAVPTDSVIKQGDFVLMDYGATVQGYRSDMTRTVAVGAVSPQQEEVYGIVLQAQTAALAAIRAGAACAQVDGAARDIIDASPYKGLFGHSLGHSLGLEIHESPRCSTGSKDVLAVDTVTSVEPGIYIPGGFGVRIEDIVVVTKDGCRNLVASPKQLIVL